MAIIKGLPNSKNYTPLYPDDFLAIASAYLKSVVAREDLDPRQSSERAVATGEFITFVFAIFEDQKKKKNEQSGTNGEVPPKSV